MSKTISDLAMHLLEAHRAGKTKLSRKAGNFAGECVVDPQPLTERQAEWLRTLAQRAGLPATDLGEGA
jgi:hypothetical protein